MTLGRQVTLSGIGIHSGADATITLRPAPEGTGILFVVDGGSLPVFPENVVDTSRCTVLGVGNRRISTVEHLLSACAGLGISDLEVTVEGPELPIGDGSAMLWCEAFAEAGISGTPPLRPVLTAPVLVTGNHGAFLAAYPAERLTITVAMHYDHPLLGTQVARFTDGDDYATQIAPARTFGLIEEVEALRKAGLAKGGSIENAVVVYPDHFSSPLRFDNEMARHKLLDVMGDLFVAGPLPHADIIAVKPGHRLNARFANDLQMVTRYPS